MIVPERAGGVRVMVTRIAARYDRMNSLMTGGRHHAWRRHVARLAAAALPGPALDLATGTADLALALRALDPTRLVVGGDFAEGMLRDARAKLGARDARRVPLVACDALALPFPSRTFACVMSALLLRNLEDLETALRDMRPLTLPRATPLPLQLLRPPSPPCT